MRYFLLVYNREDGKVERDEAFDDESAALAERFLIEKERKFDPQIEVVVLGAESHEALRNTHARYFEGPGELLSTDI